MRDESSTPIIGKFYRIDDRDVLYVGKVLGNELLSSKSLAGLTRYPDDKRRYALLTDDGDALGFSTVDQEPTVVGENLRCEGLFSTDLYYDNVGFSRERARALRELYNTYLEVATK